MIVKRIWLVAGAALLGAAVVEELMKPAEERTWQGRALGLVPYDLRAATPEGFREAMDRPEDAHLVLGVRFDLRRIAGLAGRALR